jgi:LytR cell envelope-related transcriptional attenuator
MATVVVLNNSRIHGLAHRVAAEVAARGWAIPRVGNLGGLVPSTTVYYAPGDEAAAEHLASEFSQIQRIEPDSEGRINEPGLTLVATRFWTD